jgi:Protein of unknown function (DUF2934)
MPFPMRLSMLAPIQRSESAGDSGMQRDHNKIQERAYEIWDREGRQDGRAEEYWAQAERELGTDAGSVQGITVDPTVAAQAKKTGGSASSSVTSPSSAKRTDTGQRKRRGSQSARQG